jgi:restriction system protein
VARKRSKSQDTAVAQLIGLCVVGCAFSPFLRGLLLWALLVIVAALAVAVVYRLTTGPKRFDWTASATERSPSVQLDSTASLKAIEPLVTSRSSVTDTKRNTDVKSLDWFQFEKLVAAVYEQKGFSVTRSGGANPDGGIDLVISKEGITSAVQCKHWKSWKVGVKQIREFLGALADRGIQNGIFITLQQYTDEAKELAARHHIQLIGESELMHMLETVNWKFNPAITTILYDTRKICPKCESEMVIRTARKGSNAGSQFWGCSAYPKCRSTLVG